MAKSKSAWWTLAVLFAINGMNFYDRIIPGAINEDLKKEFSLYDWQIGVIGTMFLVLYAFVGLPLGWLADRVRRTRLLGVGVFLWSLLTAGSGLAESFRGLLGWRLGVGVGEAFCAPAASSMIGDMFPAAKRAMAMSIFMMGLPLGNAAGLAVSGYLAQEFSWRYAFYVAAIPGLILAFLAFLLPEPQRGAAETHDLGGARRQGNAFLLVLSIPTMAWIIASGALHNFNMYALGQFLGSYLRRYYEVDAKNAGYASMFIFGLSGIPGLVFGGILGDAIRRTKINGRLLVASAAIAISVPCMLVALSQEKGQEMMFGLWMGIGCGVMYAYYSTVYSTIQDVVEPALRGSAMAIYFCVMYLCGGALGSVGCGFLSDYCAKRVAAAHGITETAPEALAPYAGQGLHDAMFIIPLFGALLTIVLFAASRSVAGDVNKLQTWMASQSSK